MLPTRQQVEEKLSSAGYDPANFFSQPHGWFVLYKNKLFSPSIQTDMRLHYLHLPEVDVGPFYILCFTRQTNEWLMVHVGLETLRIESEEDLNKIEPFVHREHRFTAYQMPVYFQNTQYEPAREDQHWGKLFESWREAFIIGINNENDWEKWRNKVTSLLSKSADSLPAGK